MPLHFIYSAHVACYLFNVGKLSDQIQVLLGNICFARILDSRYGDLVILRKGFMEDPKYLQQEGSTWSHLFRFFHLKSTN